MSQYHPLPPKKKYVVKIMFIGTEFATLNFEVSRIKLHFNSVKISHKMHKQLKSMGHHNTKKIKSFELKKCKLTARVTSVKAKISKKCHIDQCTCRDSYFSRTDSNPDLRLFRASSRFYFHVPTSSQIPSHNTS